MSAIYYHTKNTHTLSNYCLQLLVVAVWWRVGGVSNWFLLASSRKSTLWRSDQPTSQIDRARETGFVRKVLFLSSVARVMQNFRVIFDAEFCKFWEFIVMNGSQIISVWNLLQQFYRTLNWNHTIFRKVSPLAAIVIKIINVVKRHSAKKHF